jgi:hypothetical protein
MARVANRTSLVWLYISGLDLAMTTVICLLIITLSRLDLNTFSVFNFLNFYFYINF